MVMDIQAEIEVQSTQVEEIDTQPLLQDEPENEEAEIPPFKIGKKDYIYKSFELDHSDHSTCGNHTHGKGTKFYQECRHLPWGRIYLHELEKTRQEIMVERYLHALKKGTITLHHAALLFIRHELDLLKPITKMLPYDLVASILDDPQNFNYSCMTLCDVKLLQQTILSYFGVKRCACEGFLGLSFTNMEQVSLDEYNQRVDGEITCLSTDAVKKLLQDYQITMKCISCAEQ